MKARRRRRSAFIVSRCLEPQIKSKARVFDMALQNNILSRGHGIELMNFCSLHENMNSQYRRVAIGIVYFEQSKFHRALSACFKGAANESHLR